MSASCTTGLNLTVFTTVTLPNITVVSEMACSSFVYDAFACFVSSFIPCITSAFFFSRDSLLSLVNRDLGTTESSYWPKYFSRFSSRLFLDKTKNRIINFLNFQDDEAILQIHLGNLFTSSVCRRVLLLHMSPNGLIPF